MDTRLDSRTDPSGRGAADTVPLAGSGRDAVAFVSGARVDRYILLDRAGEGGMGVVFSAYDPQLDRRVAIKILRGEGHDPRASARRLLREARAMARLSHPNVITVHDFGTVGSRVFVAMEFVEGTTLKGWLATPRSWREIVATFARAGRGLQAAHAGGLVHGDFKPDNVLVGADGRVRVTDFGLARSDPSTRSDPAIVEGQEVTLVDSVAGAAAGTPAYMAPEQHLRESVDAASDQFAFCVALYEALYGVRPFPGNTWATVALSVLGTAPVEPPRDSLVPPRIARLVLRGLARERKDRHPDMASLLAALADDPRRRGRRRAWFGASLLLTAGLAAGLGALWSARQHDDRCTGGAAEMATVWNDDAARQLAAAFAGSDRPYAGAAAGQVPQILDAYADRWAATHRQACEATRVRGEASTEILDRKMACLARRRAELAGLVEGLGRADGTAIERAVVAAQQLPGPETCVDLGRLERGPALPEDPQVAASAQALRERLGRLFGLLRLGRFAEAEALAGPLAADAEALGFLPVQAEVVHQVADLASHAGNTDLARKGYEDAYFLGLRSGDHVIAARAATSLVHLFGYTRGEFDRAAEWDRHADATAAQADDREIDAFVHNTRGTLAYARGDYPRSRDEHAAALALREELYGGQDDRVAISLNNLGIVYQVLGDNERSRELLERALAIREVTLGPDHPDYAQVLLNLSTAVGGLGQLEAAQDLLERALDIRMRTQGPMHPEVGIIHTNLGAIAAYLGKPEENVEHQRKASAIWKAAGDGATTHLAASSANLCDGLVTLGRWQEAIEAVEPALAYYRGASHPALPIALRSRARAYRGLERNDLARADLEAAMAAVEAQGGNTNPEFAQTAVHLAALDIDEGRVDEAVARLERARSAIEEVPSVVHAEAEFELARAHALRGEATRARTQAEAARVEAAGAEDEGLVRRIDAWLAVVPRAE